MPDLRWKFAAELTVKSPLHIGDGSWTKVKDRPQNTDEIPEPEAAAVFLAPGGKPYLPATSLKGWLRSLSAQHLGDDETKRIFGSGELGGLLYIFDALYAREPNPEHLKQGAGVHWCPERRTCISSHVVIDRYTRTAADELLFFREYVPEGTTFTLELELRFAGQDTAFAISALLSLLASGSTHSLGANGAIGWGMVEVSNVAVQMVDSESLKAWLKAKAHSPIPYKPVSAPATPLQLPDSNRLSYRLELDFQGAFASNDSSRMRTGKDDKRDNCNLEPRRLRDQPYLPHSSLHGALRNRAEKIWRTLGNAAPIPGETNIVAALKECRDLDVPSLLFGTSGWRSPIRIYGQTCLRVGTLEKQEMVSIDRFTGGAADERKFNARSFWQPKLQLHLDVDTQRLEAANHPKIKEAFVLLAYVLRDLADGLITLGAGTAKGYGRCIATIARLQTKPLIPRDEFELLFLAANDRYVGKPAPHSDSAPNVIAMNAASCNGQHVYNPYHFAPVAPVVPAAAANHLSDLEKGANQLGFHALHNGLKTGYIDCTLTTETPLFIGNTQSPAAPNPTLVHPFQRPQEGPDSKPVIPATSLRGMFSSQFEAQTNSALRVLNDSYYSRRKAKEKSLSAIGLVVKRPDGNTTKWAILPLALPSFNPHELLSPKWRTFFPVPVLKRYEPESQLNWIPGAPPVTRSLAPLQWIVSANGAVLDVGPAENVHQSKRGELRLGVKTGTVQTTGILRSLGMEGRQRPANNKYHELFIPVPDPTVLSYLEESRPGENLLPLPDPVVSTFHAVCDHVVDSYQPSDQGIRPYEPAGTRPSRKPLPGRKPARLRLQPGDIVYFKANDPLTRVEEISFSAMWRAEIEGRTFQHFERLGSNAPNAKPGLDLLPMSDYRRALLAAVPREDKDVPITPAEKLFGFVEMREIPDDKKSVKLPRLAALASRVTFSDGIYQDNLTDGPYDSRLVTLKILSSPKPPCPSMYFAGQQNVGYLAKEHLKPGGNRKPRGRKFYLHHGLTQNSQPWETKVTDPDNNKQRMQIKPIQSNAMFHFRVHFENLTELEYQQLIRSLRPSPKSRYKLGLGKPLGLGTVRIDLAEQVQILNPAKRYTEDSFLEEHPGFDGEALPVFTPLPESNLTILNETAFDTNSVNYPTVRHAANEPVTPERKELKLFEWFVANEAIESEANRKSLGNGTGVNALPRHVVAQ